MSAERKGRPEGGPREDMPGNHTTGHPQSPPGAAEIAEALGGKSNGRGWMACCPAHDDRNPSLSISQGDNGPLVHCHAGCDQQAVIDALRARGLWPDPGESGEFGESARFKPAPPPGESGESGESNTSRPPAPPVGTDEELPAEYPGRGRPSARWLYRDAEGRPVAAAYRFDGPGGKEVLPLHWDGSAWRPGAPPKPRPLYGLDQLAAAPQAPVVVAEGEKAADAAGRLIPGAVPVASMGGSGAAQHADWRPLQGRRVLVWPDADADYQRKGGKFAREAARQAVAAGAESVKVLDPFAAFDSPEQRLDGWDAADAEGEGWTPDAVAKAISEHARPYDDWPEVIPLRRPPASAQPYPVEDLGAVLGKAARAVEEIVQAPDALCGSSFLGAAALAAQALRDIELPHGERKPLSLYLMTVAESGERKSSIDQHALAPIRKHEKDCRADYEAQLQTYEMDKEAFEKAKSQALKQAKGDRDSIRAALEGAGCARPPQPPIHPRRLLEDMTVEGIYRHYEQGQPSAGLFSDEGGLFVGGHGMLPDHILKTITRLSKLWDGAPYDRARGGEGVATLYGRRMSLSLLMQSRVAARLLGEDIAENQGFLPRCLIAWPASRQGGRQYRTDDPGESSAMSRYFARLKELLETEPRTEDGRPQELDPPPLRFSAEAAKLYAEFHDSLEPLLGSGGDLVPVRASASKTPEQAARIAGVLAVVEQGPEVEEIDATTYRRAMRIASYYLNERLRLVEAETVPESIRRAEALLAWLKDRGERYVYSSLLVQYGPREAGRTAAEVQETMSTLAQHGYARPVEGGAEIDGKHRRHVWEVRHDLDG